MPVYVLLANMTDQGRRRMKATIPRLRPLMQEAEQHGIKVIGWWLTMGPYDSVAVVEAPSDEAIAMATLGESMNGDVETVTMRAFTLDEAERLVGQLPTPS